VGEGADSFPEFVSVGGGSVKGDIGGSSVDVSFIDQVPVVCHRVAVVSGAGRPTL
jgi:hypothetical protein